MVVIDFFLLILWDMQFPDRADFGTNGRLWVWLGLVMPHLLILPIYLLILFWFVIPRFTLSRTDLPARFPPVKVAVLTAIATALPFGILGRGILGGAFTIQSWVAITSQLAFPAAVPTGLTAYFLSKYYRARRSANGAG